MVILLRSDENKSKFLNENGTPVSSEMLNYIKNLPPIPPAYKNVRIYYPPDKILYDGIDDKGRLQQIYTREHREKADKKKFKLLIKFGKALPSINAAMDNALKSKTLTKDKAISLILKVIILCGFRIGQLKYQVLYGSHGISNVMKKHFTFKKDELIIKFKGKKGVINTCVINDKDLMLEFDNIIQNKKQDDYIFETVESALVKPIEVNNWLKKYDADFTTKLFRTFGVNSKLAKHLAEIKIPEKITSRKKVLVEAIKKMSDCINNTPAICKKSYLDLNLIKMYIEQPKKFSSIFVNQNDPDENLIEFLKKIYE